MHRSSETFFLQNELAVFSYGTPTTTRYSDHITAN